MGLDMTLSAKKYIGGHYTNIHPEAVPLNELVQKLMGVTYPVMYVTLHIGDWRKANAIHNWFVDNVQGGTDDCGEYEVPHEQLRELLEVCELIKREPERASELLPCAEGFFFGGTEYDEWYFKDIDYTIDMLSKVFVEQELFAPNLDFMYSSSW